MNELYEIWNHTSKGLDESIKINDDILSQKWANKIRLKLYLVPFRNIINLLFSLPFILFLLDFANDHVQELRFFIPAMTMILLTLLSVGISLLNIITYLDIRPFQPIYQTQKKLEKLLLQEVWENRSLILIIPFFGLAFLIVIAKYRNNIDILSELGYNWIIYYLMGSFFIALILVFFLQLFPDRKIKKALKEIKDLNENNQ